MSNVRDMQIYYVDAIKRKPWFMKMRYACCSPIKGYSKRANIIALSSEFQGRKMGGWGANVSTAPGSRVEVAEI